MCAEGEVRTVVAGGNTIVDTIEQPEDPCLVRVFSSCSKAQKLTGAHLTPGCLCNLTLNLPPPMAMLCGGVDSRLDMGWG